MTGSNKSFRFALAVGLFFAALAFAYRIYAIDIVFIGMTVPGWASLKASIVFLSGIQLLVLGVIGEYIGKMYMELKQRPAYLITKTNIVRSIIPSTKEAKRTNTSERRTAMI